MLDAQGHLKIIDFGCSMNVKSEAASDKKVISVL